MTDQSTLKVTICFDDPALDAEERDKEVQNLLNQLKNLDEVKASRVDEPNLPDTAKALGGWISGILMAEVNFGNFKKLMSFLGDRLSGKPIELEIEINGNKLKVKAGSKAGLDAAIASAQAFVEVLKAQKAEG
jgi:hypothetical protein